MFSRKIRHVAIRSGSIRWISIRFDAEFYEFSLFLKVLYFVSLKIDVF